jgi:predicted molibdopterin-dependent oxidoreductase YjgC
MTRNSQGLKTHRYEELLEISSEDAQDLGLEKGEVVRVISRRGEVKVRIQVTDRVPKGVVFMTFHFKESAANILTSSELDPTSKTPELKVATVRIEKI